MVTIKNRAGTKSSPTLKLIFSSNRLFCCVVGFFFDDADAECADCK